MISTKDFSAIAANIEFLRNQSAGLTSADDMALYRTALADAAHAVADACEANNPRFQRERFMTACGFPAVQA